MGELRLIKGFTLIEILIVLIIIAISASAIFVKVGHSDNLKLMSTVETMEMKLKYASQVSIMKHEDLLVKVDDEGYKTYVRGCDGWVPILNRDLVHSKWPENLNIKTRLNSDYSKGILFKPDGTISPFKLDIACNSILLRITGNYLAEISIVNYD